MTFVNTRCKLQSLNKKTSASMNKKAAVYLTLAAASLLFAVWLKLSPDTGVNFRKIKRSEFYNQPIRYKGTNYEAVHVDKSPGMLIIHGVTQKPERQDALKVIASELRSKFLSSPDKPGGMQILFFTQYDDNRVPYAMVSWGVPKPADWFVSLNYPVIPDLTNAEQIEYQSKLSIFQAMRKHFDDSKMFLTHLLAAGVPKEAAMKRLPERGYSEEAFLKRLAASGQARTMLEISTIALEASHWGWQPSTMPDTLAEGLLIEESDRFATLDHSGGKGPIIFQAAAANPGVRIMNPDAGIGGMDSQPQSLKPSLDFHLSFLNVSTEEQQLTYRSECGIKGTYWLDTAPSEITSGPRNNFGPCTSEQGKLIRVFLKPGHVYALNDALTLGNVKPGEYSFRLQASFDNTNEPAVSNAIEIQVHSA